MKKISNSISNNIRFDPLYENFYEAIDFSNFLLNAYNIKGPPGHPSLAAFTSFSEVVDGFNNGQLSPSEFQAFLGVQSMLLQMSTESSVNESLRQGCGFMPLPLQTKLIISSPKYRFSASTMLEKVGKAHLEEGKELRDLMVNKYSRKTKIPLLFGYILSNATSTDEIFNTALNLRDEKDVTQYRKWCVTLDPSVRGR